MKVMKKRNNLLAIVCASILSVSCVTPVFACTPKLNPPSVKIPDITVKLDDKLQDAISAAAKKFIEKNVLEEPVIQNASYFYKTLRYGTYSCLNIKWDEVENYMHLPYVYQKNKPRPVTKNYKVDDKELEEIFIRTYDQLKDDFLKK